MTVNKHLMQWLVLLVIGMIGACSTAAYDRQAVDNYANTWWNRCNHTCGTYTSCSPYSYWGSECCGYASHGGDCANFTSQSVLAGGHPYLNGGLPCRGYPCGKEEIGAKNLGDCLVQKGWTRTCGYHQAPPANIQVGDVLIYHAGSCSSYDTHATVITYVSGSDIRISAHSSAQNDRAYTYLASSKPYYEWLHYPSAGFAQVSQGVTVSPSPVISGANFTVNFTLKEIWGASKTFEHVAVAVLRSDNTLVYDMAMYDNVTIPAYGIWSQSPVSSLNTSNPAGTYKIEIRGQVDGAWFAFGTVDSGVNPREIQVVAAPSDDAYEPNNSLSAAWYPGSNWVRQWLSALRGYGIQRDDDWYRIWVSSNYQRVNVDCRFSHAAGDIDIALYNAAGTRLSSSTSVTDNEWLDYTVPTGNAWYYIRVYYGNRGNSYNLWWDGLYSGSSGGTGYLLWTK